MRRHLEDENHEITDEEMRNVKIVATDDEPTTTGAEAAARFAEDEAEERDKEKNNDAKPDTPWNVLSE